MALRRIGRFLGRLLLALLGLAVLVFGVPTAIVYIDAGPHTFSAENVAPHDVTLVMGAAMWGKTPSPALQKRLDVAAQLYLTGKTKVIIVSGHVDGGYNEPAGMKAALVAAGVPADKIVADNKGDDTYSSCARALDVFGVSSLIVVTQTYHLPRALATCRLLHIDAVGVGTGPGTYDATWFKYQAREIAANVKLMYQLATDYKIPSAKPSDAVQKALDAP